MKAKIKIKMVKKEASPKSLINAIAFLINDVYEEAESGMWNVGVSRTNHNEIREMIKKEEIFIATMNEILVGAIRVVKFSDKILEFGMLAACKKHRGLGIGRELVKEAEAYALKCGREKMRLELLTPQKWIHPSKEFLKKWYTRIGYKKIGEEDFNNMYSHLNSLLKTQCNFSVYLKNINHQEAIS